MVVHRNTKPARLSALSGFHAKQIEVKVKGNQMLHWLENLVNSLNKAETLYAFVPENWVCIWKGCSVQSPDGAAHMAHIQSCSCKGNGAK